MKKKFTIKPEYLQGVKEDMIILHPLPKIDEIPPEVDKSKHARYFEQAKNGIPMRMAIMKKMLNEVQQKKPDREQRSRDVSEDHTKVSQMLEEKG